MRLLMIVLACLGAILVTPFADAAKKKQAAAKPPKPIYEAAMTVVIVRSGIAGCEPLCPEWIAAEGEITGATPQAFRKVFKQMGKRKLPIIIRSPGGSINAALEIGRMIRKRKLDVAVGTTEFLGCHPNDKNCKLPKERKADYRGKTSEYHAFCNSACPMVLAAGTIRLASFGASVGVHQPKTIWTQDRITYRDRYKIVKGKKKVIARQILSRKALKPRVTFGYDKRLRKMLFAYFNEMGVDSAIMNDSNKAAFAAINKLSGARLTELKLRTTSLGLELLTANLVCAGATIADNCVRDESFAKQQQDKQAALETERAELFKKKAMSVGITDKDPAMTVVLVRNRSRNCEPLCPEWIAAQGVITPKTPQQFAAILATNKDKPLPIVIDSIGGDFDAAVEIAEMIRASKSIAAIATTAILGCKPADSSCSKGLDGKPYKGFILTPGNCHGACVAMLAGAQVRLGYSQGIEIFSPQNFSTGAFQTVEVQLHTLFGRANISNQLLQDMKTVSLGDRKFISWGQLGDYRLITNDAYPEIISQPASCSKPGELTVCVTR